jgi:flagellin
MALNSIMTNVGAYYAQSNIGRASENASLSIARLSSGQRIVRAADDVASMSAGTSLKTNVTTLKMALINTSQGSSLLQVADGALAQITDILQRQKAIAVQAGSGSLTSSERSFLNQEFQNLTDEVERLATQTNFNGVSLLDGVLTKTVSATDVTTAADLSSARIDFNVNNTGVQTVILNGVTFTGAATSGTVTFAVGATTEATLDSLVTVLNASTNTSISSATYSRDGTSLVVTAKAGGVGGQDYIISGDGTWTVANDAANLGGPNSGVNIAMFQVAVGPLSAEDSAVANGANSSALLPFDSGTDLTAQVGNGTAVTIVTAAEMVAGLSLNDIIDTINAKTVTSGITARLTGYSGNYNIELSHSNADLDDDGVATTGGDFTIGGTAIAAGMNNLGAALANTAAANSVPVQYTGLGGGGEVGIGAGDTVGIGSIGDTVLTDQTQTRSSTTILFPPITDANLATSLVTVTGGPVAISIGEAAVAAEQVAFRFSSEPKADVGPMEIALGSTLEETLNNAVEAINSYDGNGMFDFDFSQIRARRDGNNLVIETIKYGDARHLDPATGTGVNLDVDLNAAAATSSISLAGTGTLTNGTTTGVTTNGVTNADFVGTVSGFTATYNGTANTVSLSVTVGSHTYTATSAGTLPTADTTVRLSSSTGGGYFDIEIRANNGTAVSSQAGADTFAARIDAAFSTLNFYQNRDISSYDGADPIVTDGEITGSLAGTTVSLQGYDFTDLKISDISVTAPAGSNPNGEINITINDEVFSSASNIGGTLGAYQTYKFVSATDSDRFMEFTTGGTAIEFDAEDKAASFQAALEAAFGVGEGSEALTFQVGATISDTLSVSINGVTTDDLDISTLDVLTQANAAIAADALDEALNIVTSVRAEVGALQSRFDFAAANVESSIQNQDAARGVLLDTDIAAESTAFSTAQVQLQAGIAVLAQANLLPQNLLKLIG